MLYALEQGPTEKSIIEQCIRSKRPLPAAIANAPVLLWGLEGFYLAFMDLSSDRQMGFGAEGPIPWSSINRYAIANGFVGEARDDLEFFMREMDITYLEHRAKKTTKTKPPANHTPAKGARTILKGR